MTLIPPSNGRVVAYIVGLENYVRTGRIRPVDYACRDAMAFAQVLPVAFPGRTVEVTTRVDDEATLASLLNELPYNIAGLHEDDLFVFYYAADRILWRGWKPPHGIRQQRGEFGGNHLAAQAASHRSARSVALHTRLVFIDACAEKLEVPGSTSSGPSTWRVDALAAAHFHAVFLSCEPGQTVVWKRRTATRNWTHFLLRALRGEAIEALGIGRILHRSLVFRTTSGGGSGFRREGGAAPGATTLCEDR